MNLKLAPGKIAVKKVEAKLSGGLELPATRAKAFDIGEIVEVGNLESFGYEGKESTAEKFKPGDIVLFQLPMHVASLASHTIKGVLTLFMSVSDVIAKLDNNRDKDGRVIIQLENFKIAGRYLLLQPTIRDLSKVIIVPDTAEETRKESIHFSVLQMGADVKIDVYKGQEVFPNRGRVNTVFVDGKEVCFVDQQFIDGAMTSK